MRVLSKGSMDRQDINNQLISNSNSLCMGLCLRRQVYRFRLSHALPHAESSRRVIMRVMTWPRKASALDTTSHVWPARLRLWFALLPTTCFWIIWIAASRNAPSRHVAERFLWWCAVDHDCRLVTSPPPHLLYYANHSASSNNARTALLGCLMAAFGMCDTASSPIVWEGRT